MQEELAYQKQLVAELQEKLASLHQYPPGLSPKSIQGRTQDTDTDVFHSQSSNVPQEKMSSPSPSHRNRKLEHQMQKSDEELKKATEKIKSLENELLLRSRLESIAAKVSVLEKQHSIPLSSSDLLVQETPVSSRFDSLRPSSAESETSEISMLDEKNASILDEKSSNSDAQPVPKLLQKSKSKDQLGAVQKRIMSLEEQLVTAKKTAKAKRVAALRSSQSEEQEDSADVQELKHQLNVARQKSQELGLLQRQTKQKDSHTASLENEISKVLDSWPMIFSPNPCDVILMESVLICCSLPRGSWVKYIVNRILCDHIDMYQSSWPDLVTRLSQPIVIVRLPGDMVLSLFPSLTIENSKDMMTLSSILAIWNQTGETEGIRETEFFECFCTAWMCTSPCVEAVGPDHETEILL